MDVSRRGVTESVCCIGVVEGSQLEECVGGTSVGGALSSSAPHARRSLKALIKDDAWIKVEADAVIQF